MFFAALHDLQWRRRRIVIAILGTALVFAMTLLLTGLANRFDVEASRTVRQFGADAWVVADGASGPFLGASPFLSERWREIAALPGVERADPVFFARKTVGEDLDVDVNLIGAPPRGVFQPNVSDGRLPVREGEVAVSTELDNAVGEMLRLGNNDFEVVGRMPDATALANTPNVLLTLEDAQHIASSDHPIATSLILEGVPVREDLPSGWLLLDNDAARAELLRPLEKPDAAISFMAALLWIVAASIVGSVIYLSALERVRDFAVFKATGTSTISILGGLAFQALVVSIAAAIVGIVLGLLLAPRFPMPVEIPVRAYVLLPAVAIVVGLVASLAGLRRAVSVDPALAFG